MRTILVVSLVLGVAAPGHADLDHFESFAVEESHQIRIENRQGGPVEISPDGGENWLEIGQVTRPARRLAEGYAATVWSKDGAVCGTAVQGIRIRVRRSEREGGRGALLAIVPKEFADPPPGFGGFSPGGGGIYTNIPAGTGIFRNLAPYVGNPVYVQYGDDPEPLPRDYQPVVGDRLIISVRRPVDPPAAFVFENHIGGLAYAEMEDGQRVPLARITRPVRGAGRFDATGYTGVGCINTNHSGVITISTAPDEDGEPVFDDPFGETRGGFMVQPSRHAENEGWPIDQVMVIEPLTENDPFLEGRAPFFLGFLGLHFQSRDPSASYYCTMSVDGGDWEPLPEYIGRSATLFTADGLSRHFRGQGEARTVREGATAFRVSFPEFY
ncbi:MAG: hypothetical protein GF320_13055 [Armatimonadia bacterium]|nr:hypothetical protein [Armatimonadia bacterium]